MLTNQPPTLKSWLEELRTMGDSIDTQDTTEEDRAEFKRALDEYYKAFSTLKNKTETPAEIKNNLFRILRERFGSDAHHKIKGPCTLALAQKYVALLDKFILISDHYELMTAFREDRDQILERQIRLLNSEMRGHRQLKPVEPAPPQTQPEPELTQQQQSEQQLGSRADSYSGSDSGDEEEEEEEEELTDDEMEHLKKYLNNELSIMKKEKAAKEAKAAKAAKEAEAAYPLYLLTKQEIKTLLKDPIFNRVTDDHFELDIENDANYILKKEIEKWIVLKSRVPYEPTKDDLEYANQIKIYLDNFQKSHNEKKLEDQIYHAKQALQVAEKLPGKNKQMSRIKAFACIAVGAVLLGLGIALLVPSAGLSTVIGLSGAALLGTGIGAIGVGAAIGAGVGAHTYWNREKGVAKAARQVATLRQTKLFSIRKEEELKECSVVEMSMLPTLKSFEKINANAAYVHFGNELFYVNKHHKICEKIKLSKEKLHEYKDAAPKTYAQDRPITLTDDQLKQVQNITGYTHKTGPELQVKEMRRKKEKTEKRETQEPEQGNLIRMGRTAR